MKFIFSSILLFFIISINAQNVAFNKYVLDQNKLYNLTVKDAILILEIRELNKTYDEVSYKLVPTENKLAPEKIIWDIQEGYLYLINLGILNSDNLASSIKKYKIIELNNNLNFDYSKTPVLTKSTIENKPFVELFEKITELDKYTIDLSVNNKINLMFKSDQTSALYTSDNGQNWDKIDFKNTSYSNYVALKNQYYINQDIVYTNLECSTCTQQKSARDTKKFPYLIINKDENKLVEIPAILEIEKGVSVDLETTISKTGHVLSFD